MRRNCEACGKSFAVPRKGPNARFCSMRCSGARRRRPLLVRFCERFISGADDECWIWTGARIDGRKPFDERYGVIRRDAADGGGRVAAHRCAYEMWVGPIPDGMHVLHSCDTPPCVNPAHLWLGTHADNMADKARKGRAPRTSGTFGGVNG